MASPELPRVYIDTTYHLPTGATQVVGNGGDFQAALNTAALNSIITLNAGSTYTGPFTLPNKTSGSGWIYVISSALALLPADCARVFPSMSALMPKIQGGPGLQTNATAHHYRFVGIEFIPPTSGNQLMLVLLGTGSETVASDLPHDITFDRCYLHGDVAATQEVWTGINMSSASTAVINSYLAGFRSTTQDAQALTTTNGSGPFRIVNNYMEATGETILIGGGDPHITNQVPSDVEIRYNYMAKPLSWRVGDPAYAGTAWRVKNLFELKNVQRVLIDGNVLENNWVQADQQGFAIVFTPRNQGNTAPWSIVQDVTFTHNYIRHSTAGMLTAGFDTTFSSQQLQRVLIKDNVFLGIGDYAKGDARDGYMYDQPSGSADVVFDHNTHFQTTVPFNEELVGAHPTTSGFIFQNNLMNNGTGNGVVGDGAATCLAVLSQYMPSGIFTKNVMWGGNAANYPAGNFFPASVSFVNYPADLHLIPGSPWHNAGTDGKDLGADIDALNLATATAVSGACPGATVWSYIGGGSVQKAPPLPATWQVSFASVGTTVKVLKNGKVVFSG